ncbi:hypothetical protein GHT06_015440 [Daphnia sinensis]|uniref:Uncharacterized protein n=1 Tax=Daphnia sinensis TaxID=1820382 RepID=A0AAD5KR69_9CRUS|nr:hypothetical protein GHT06_015440 [Daphnia sinensis]
MTNEKEKSIAPQKLRGNSQNVYASVIAKTVHISSIQSGIIFKAPILLMVILLGPIQQQKYQIRSGKLLVLIQLEKVIDVDQHNLINTMAQKIVHVSGGFQLCWKTLCCPYDRIWCALTQGIAVLVYSPTIDMNLKH